MKRNFSIDFNRLSRMNIEDIRGQKERLYARSLSTRNNTSSFTFPIRKKSVRKTQPVFCSEVNSIRNSFKKDGMQINVELQNSCSVFQTKERDAVYP